MYLYNTYLVHVGFPNQPRRGPFLKKRQFVNQSVNQSINWTGELWTGQEEEKENCDFFFFFGMI